MHDQTLYSRPWIGDDGKKYVSVRKPVEGAIVNDIIDARIRQIVQEKIAQLGNQKALATNPPLDDAGRPIRKVRVRTIAPSDLATIGTGPRSRQVKLSSIHHAEILLDESVPGKSKYRCVIVSTFEAMRRHKIGIPVVQKDHGERMSFVCSLRGKDTIELDKGDGRGPQYWRVRSIETSGQVQVHSINDARTLVDIKAAKCLWKPVVNTLFTSGARKIRVDYLGVARPAND